MIRHVTVLGVPSSAGAHAPGQERAPAAFRQAGLLDLLGARLERVTDLGDLPAVRWSPDRASPRAQHAGLVAEVADRVADRVAGFVETVRTADAGPDADPDAGPAEVLLVLGGDCTIEVGVVAGFARAGERVGLIYLDAGPDLNVPSAVRLGFLDWMGMAHLLGVPGATPELSGLGRGGPLLRADQVVFAGTVAEELTDFERTALADRDLPVVWCPEVAADPAAAAARALAALGPGVTRILLHFDVDVVDFLDFPAADFPTINAGLTLGQALAFIAEVAGHPAFAALTVCEFNPDHVDEQHAQVREFAERLVRSLTGPADSSAV